MTTDDMSDDNERRRHKIRLGSRSVTLPENRIVRIGVGCALILGGVFWWIPVLGLWMIPLGLFILSIDMHWARRLRRRAGVWLARRYPGIAEKLNGTSQ